MYSVDIRPKNLLRGNAVNVFLRENGRTTCREIELPHIIPSQRMENSIADKHLETLKKSTRGIKYETKRYKGNTVIHAKGPREMKDQLENFEGIFMPSSPTDMARWQANFSFSIVKEENGKIIFSDKKADIQTLLDEKAVALDLEVDGWKEAEETGDIKKERIAMASFTTMSDFGNFIFSIYELDVTDIEVNGYKSKIIICKNEEDLIQKITQMFHDYDPLWVFGSNVGKYDLLKLREKGEDTFTPSADEDEPKTEATCGFFKRVIIKGEQVIDSAPFSQNWLWFPRNNLTTVGNGLLDECEKKDISYDQLDAFFKSRDPNGLTIVAKYNFKDTIRSFQIGKKMLIPTIFMSKLFAASPSSVCTSSKSLGKNFDRKRHFEKYNTLIKKDRNKEKEYDKFNINKLKYDIWNQDCEKTGEHSALSVKRGAFKDVDVVFLTPFIEALRDILRSQEAYHEIFKYNNQLDQIDKIIICQAMNAFLKKPIFDINKLTGFNYIHSAYDILERRDRAFGYSYDVFSPIIHHSGEARVNNIQRLNNKVIDAIMKTNELLKSTEVINYSDKFIFFKDSAGIAQQLQEMRLGRSLGKASVLSVGKGRILFSINNSKSGMVFSQGIDPTGTKGNRTKLETELISEFVKLALMDQSVALQFIQDRARELAEGRIEKERLEYRTRKTSEPSRENSKVDQGKYLDKLFGPKSNCVRDFGKGSIGLLLDSVLPMANKRELTRIVEGDPSARIEKLIQTQLALF